MFQDHSTNEVYHFLLSVYDGGIVINQSQSVLLVETELPMHAHS
jgi:hypothetical protein